MNRVASWLLGLLLLAGLAGPAAGEDAPWYGTDAAGRPVVELYFFWSERCPHCLEARPFVQRLARENDWLRLHEREVSGSRENARLYQLLAGRLGRQAQSVPAFLFCRSMLVGYEDAATTGARLKGLLQACHRRLAAGEAAPQVLEPGMPEVAQGRSLALVTVMLAGLDAFNPCAFFVLLFLLSVLVHARSRARMFLVGGVFVLFSGLFYFAFMAAWLNLFLLVGGMGVVTAVAGVLAVVLALVNIKDYLRPGRGPSLSIPERAKPGLFQRMQGLLRAERLPTMLVGTVALAAAANSYELLCTAGFPMVFTRILTLQGLGAVEYYLYLLFYNLIYVLPLALIVVVFVLTLGRRKLGERQGRLLKLLSGLMMLGLGTALLVAPERLARVATAAALVAAALAGTAIAWLWERWRGRPG